MAADQTLQRAVDHYRSGDLAEAEHFCRQALDRNSANADALHLLGLMRLGAADYLSAKDLLRQAASAAPDNAACWYNLGEAYRSLGLFKEAAESYKQALALRPSFGEARNNLGIVLAEMGLFDEAIQTYEQALLANPDSLRTLMNLGNALTETGRLPEALPCFERALVVDGDFMEAYDGFCRASGAAEKPGEESTRLASVLEERPNAAHALDNLSAALEDLNRLDEALSVTDRALRIDPRSASIHRRRGLLLKRLGSIDEAYRSLKNAVDLAPDCAEAHNDLGRFFYEQGLLDEAKRHFQKTLQRNDGFAAAHSHLGAILAREGLLDAAADHYTKAENLNCGDSAYKVIKATLAPVIPGSMEEIRSFRSAMEGKLDELLGQGLSIDDPFRAIGKVNFFLAYQGLEDDRAIQTKLARFHEAISPDLTFVAPHCMRMRPAGPGKIKIGFVSRHFRNHTIGNYIRGVIGHLDRDVFEVHLFPVPRKRDDLSASIEESADSVTAAPETLFLARRVIAAKELDILFYPEIGMDPFTYFLAFSRLAPVQCAFYGHPITTGMKSIDYFISHEDCELAGAETHYSEKLLKLSEKVAYAYYCRPRASTSRRERCDFHLPDGARIYLCAQSLFKVHPDFDSILGSIMNKDKIGIIVFFEGEHATWTHSLRERLKKSVGNNIDRVWFVPRQIYDDYLRLIGLSDAVLDTPHFSGGATSFDALSLGVPIVALPGAFLRGRQTYALYKRMGVMDCVAATPEEYVDIALRLAADAPYREAVRQKILEKNHLIFEDLGMVRELEKHLVAMVKTE